MVTRGDTIADRLTHPHNANVGNFNFRQDAIDFRDYDSRDRRQFSPRKKPMRDRDPEKQKSNQTGMVLQQIPVSRPAFPLRPELRLVSTDLGQHLSQTSAAAQHAQHVVACTTSRTRQWRHRTISRRHVVRCDRSSSSRQVRDSWKARRRRTFSTRVSSMLGGKTLMRTFLKISRRSLCVQCL